MKEKTKLISEGIICLSNQQLNQLRGGNTEAGQLLSGGIIGALKPPHVFQEALASTGDKPQPGTSYAPRHFGD